MHRYFLIPIISFFIIICGFVIYMQFINEDWKYLVPQTILPETCDDNTYVKFVIHDEDHIDGRSFQDKEDTFNGNQFHAIYLLPCERKDRQFDVRLNIETSLLSINKWFFEKSAKQEINFDDFMKPDLRVARIVEAKEVPEARKLIQLTLSLGGNERRNVFAGIKSAYEPQELLGRLVIMVANLAPRKMKFGISEGMVIASGPGGKEVYLVSPDEGAVPGQRIH